MKKITAAILAIAILAALCSPAALGGDTGRPSAPENLRWDGRVLSWDPVDGALGYILELYVYVDGRAVGASSYIRSQRPNADFDAEITAHGKGDYYARVYAFGELGSESPKSVSPLTTIDTGSFKLPYPLIPGWTTAFDGGQKLSWQENPYYNYDCDYFYRATVYKDGKAQRTFDIAGSATSFDFTRSGDVPSDSASEYTVGLRLVPAAGADEYSESDENISVPVVPVELTVRRLYDVSFPAPRTGDSEISFSASFSGVYGSVEYICLEYTVKDRNGAVTKSRTGGSGIRLPTRVKETNKSFTVSDIGYTFAEGDIVEWKLFLSGRKNDPESSARGTATVADPHQHVVTFDTNGQGAGFLRLVDDKTNLYDAAYKGLYDTPTADGLRFVGWSLEPLAIGEYRFYDLYSYKVYDDVTLYAMWKYAVSEIKLDIEPPVCGTLVGTESAFDWYVLRQTNAPKASVPVGAPYIAEEQDPFGIDEVRRSWGAFIDPENGYLNFEGTVEAGREFVVSLRIVTDEDGEYAFAPVEEITVTGNCGDYAVSETEFDDHYMIAVTARVTAEHDVRRWTPLSLPTADKPGKATGKCAYCGAETAREVPLISGDVTGDGNLNARDVTAMMKHIVHAAPGVFNDAAADMTGDGAVNARDVTALMKRLVNG